MYLRMNKQEDLYDLSDNIVYVDVPKLIAEEKAQMYCGSGYEFKHNNKKFHKIWHRFVELNNFDRLAYLTEYFMGLNGVCFLTLNKNVKGEVLVNMVQPYFASGVAMSFCTPINAVIIESLFIDNQLHLIQNVYDTEKVVRTLWNAETKETVNIFNYYTTLPKDYQIDWGEYDAVTNSYTYYHNLGVVPVQDMLNKPFKHFFPQLSPTAYYQSPFTTTWNYQTTGWTYDSVKDTAKCSGLILQLQNLYTQRWKLALLDKPRVIINGVTQGLTNRLREERQQSVNSRFFSDLIVNAGYGGQNGAGIQLMTPTNSLSNYDDAISLLKKEIWNNSGLSYIVQTASQKTSTESFTNFKHSLETLNFMRDSHTKQWISLIKKMFKMIGEDLGEMEEWSFQFNRNTVIDESTQITNLVAEIEMGTITPVKAIAIRNHIDEDNAEKIWKDNDKWFKENDYMIAMQGGKGVAGTNMNPGKLDKGGRTPDNKKEVKNNE